MDQLINEICEICTRVEPDAKASWIIRRLQFMGYELAAQVSPDLPSDLKLQRLNEFFFDHQDFSVPKDVMFHDPLSLNLLNRVLSARVGSSRLLAIIYRYLGEKIGLQFEFVDLEPNCYLKYVENGKSRFIDFSRKGSSLTSDELLDSVQSRAKTKSEVDTLCESISPDEYVVQYLQVLKIAFRQRNHLEPLLIVHNWILEYQPSNTNVMGERAVLLNQLGHFRNAFSDLKRYFSFSDANVAPKELVSLFDELTQRFAPKAVEQKYQI